MARSAGIVPKESTVEMIVIVMLRGRSPRLQYVNRLLVLPPGVATAARAEPGLGPPEPAEPLEGGAWRCESCTLVNVADASACNACGAGRETQWIVV